MRLNEILPPMANAKADAEVEIKRHVVGLFDAYLAGDREFLRAGRTADWKGFQIRSTRLVRGGDEYMAELSSLLRLAAPRDAELEGTPHRNMGPTSQGGGMTRWRCRSVR